MIVILDGMGALAIPNAGHAELNNDNVNFKMLYVKTRKDGWTVATFNWEKVIGVFTKDDDYVGALGQQLIKNMRADNDSADE